jgi:hypothetical protein
MGRPKAGANRQGMSEGMPDGERLLELSQTRGNEWVHEEASTPMLATRCTGR